ncbi:peptidyl-prolyl cis-trans isomerase FKBP18, chloroplastic [Cinnamomum micranthum f. kanehirae]|uniref:peptidylprolyl isomerase n=1 Tax=Cinnamomum micranthum f. kanehirae TaxID=337451 RepID=A0A443PIF6_9MAGN|nr:peptidyl-prolyl cis-trans isomerase FKBP18, chloroplastic [Cinnamomum micranthum f. kanehirae]
MDHRSPLFLTKNSTKEATPTSSSLPQIHFKKICSSLLLCCASHPHTSLSPSTARGSRGRKTIPPEDYRTTSDGLKYYDLEEGKGRVAEKGSKVQVHFDCVYRGITAISSRESKLLAGNRSIAQAYEFTVGAPPGKERKREYVDNANGLFSAQASPKPPAAMYKITEGMKVGGKRTVLVPPEAGYGQKGMNEIPVYTTF